MLEVSGRYSMDPVFVGRGVTSLSLASHFLNKYPDKKIKIIYSEKIFSPVDSNINIIVASNGISKGVSELGDLLFHSYQYFKKNNGSFPGVQKCKQYHFFIPGKTDEAKFNRRFLGRVENLNNSIIDQNYSGVIDNSYIIKSSVYLDGLIKPYIDRVDFVNDTISSIDKINGLTLFGLSGNKYQTNKLFFAGGAYSKFLPLSFFESTRLERHKSVSGGVWVSYADLGTESFILTVNMSNFIYCHLTQSVQVTGQSDERSILCDITDGLKDNYALFDGLINKALPQFDQGEVISSLRDKGRHRLPYVHREECESYELLAMCGAYKNGYTTSSYLADRYFNKNK
jgi:hypothetical protein